MDISLLRALRSHPTMRQLSADELEYITGLGRVLCYLPGVYLFHESQPRRFWGLILHGRVELQQGPRARPRVLYVMGAGESFGEGSLLEDYPHSTSALVLEGTELFEISREAVGRIANERPALYGRLLGGAARTIAERLRSANAHLTGPGARYLSGAVRREHDLLGERDIPASCYYGIQTLRAVENFPITGIPIAQHPHLIKALAVVKQAAAEANHELGSLADDIADAIGQACREIRAGNLHSEFVVDVIQGGAGTSTNMNANEVIANRALELLGRARGDYGVVHPNNHVNLSQSTNDVYPTALRIATTWSIRDLADALAALREAFYLRGEEFSDVVKMGRTQLQDAVPMTLGQEFRAYGVTVGEDIDRLREVAHHMREINMGATAIGTGINTEPRYAAIVRERLSSITGLDLVTSPDLVEATQDTGAFVRNLSSVAATPRSSGHPRRT